MQILNTNCFNFLQNIIYFRGNSEIIDTLIIYLVYNLLLNNKFWGGLLPTIVFRRIYYHSLKYKYIFRHEIYSAFHKLTRPLLTAKSTLEILKSKIVIILNLLFILNTMSFNKVSLTKCKNSGHWMVKTKQLYIWF